MNRSASLPLVASQTEGKRPVLVRYRLGKLINIICVQGRGTADETCPAGKGE